MNFATTTQPNGTRTITTDEIEALETVFGQDDPKPEERAGLADDVETVARRVAQESVRGFVVALRRNTADATQEEYEAVRDLAAKYLGIELDFV